jgi:DNA-binding transcriptional MerR regulator
MEGGRQTYLAKDFAALAGVTVRALHHYERLGLIRPGRSPAGYRIFTAAHLERLEQILVLKFLGVRLRDIGKLLSAAPAELAAALRTQRQLLQSRRELIDRAIDAIAELEAIAGSGAVIPAALFARVIEVIDMDKNAEATTKQYEDLVSLKAERLRAMTPEALAAVKSQWAGLLEEIRNALGEDPAGPVAQRLLVRWTGLLGQIMGGPVDLAAVRRARGAEPWTPAMAAFVDQPVWDFMQQVIVARPSPS